MNNKQKPNFINPEEAFQKAIEKGILSSNENDKDYAGNFMYMYSENGKDYFKNIITKKYGFDRNTILESI
ncbi:MAG: hypothetical protein FJ368_06270 [Pelagibacterales bacterium]|nr:hypothetical protein [Pelagibacterales bacterium]